MFASSEPCVSIAGLGAPAVPAVKSSTARSVASLTTISGGVSDASTSSMITTGIPRLGDSSEDSPEGGANCGDIAWVATARRARSALRRGRECEDRIDPVDLAAQLVRRRTDVERHRHRARGEHAEIRDDECGLVPGHDHDPVARRRRTGDHRRDRADPSPELRVRDRVRPGQRAPIGRGLRGREQRRRQVHRGEATSSAPRPGPGDPLGQGRGGEGSRPQLRTFLGRAGRLRCVDTRVTPRRPHAHTRDRNPDLVRGGRESRRVAG